MTTQAGGRSRARRRAASPMPGAPEQAPAADAAPGPSVRTRARRGRVAELAAEHWRAIGAVALLILGGVLVMLGWYGTAYTNIFTEQIPYLISGGLLGLGLIIVAGFLAVSSIQAREIEALRRDLNRVLEAIAQGGGGHRGNGSVRPDGRVYVVAGGRSFHVPGCPILEGKDSEGLAPSKAADEGYVACKLCGPD